MPITVPRKVVPILEAKPAAPAALAESLTRADVSAMLADHARIFAQQIDALTKAVAALAEPKPRCASAIEFKYDASGAITGATITPKE